MLNRTCTLLIVLLACGVTSSAALVATSLPPRAVPNIPHGQNWDIALPPDPQITQQLLDLDEVVRILPLTPAIVHEAAVRELRTIVHNPAEPSSSMLVSIVIAIFLLLAGFDFIPRAHASTLRFRSIHFKDDLFS